MPYSCQMKIAWKSAKMSVKCEVCGKAFSQRCNLNIHQKSHKGENPYMCEVCGRTFSRKWILDNHQRLHTGEKPHKCPICERAFSHKSTLINHQHVHTGEKRYKCQVCKEAFAQKSHLKDHYRVHTGEKPHKCEVCGRAFSHKSTLNNHRRVHTGEKPHKCQVCERAFAQKSSLIAHRQVHTREKPYKCEVCGKVFSKKCNMNRHQSVHVREQPHQQVCGEDLPAVCEQNLHQRVHTRVKSSGLGVSRKDFSCQFPENPTHTSCRADGKPITEVKTEECPIFSERNWFKQDNITSTVHHHTAEADPETSWNSQGTAVPGKNAHPCSSQTEFTSLLLFSDIDNHSKIMFIFLDIRPTALGSLSKDWGTEVHAIGLGVKIGPTVCCSWSGIMPLVRRNWCITWCVFLGVSPACHTCQELLLLYILQSFSGGSPFVSWFIVYWS